MVTELDRLARSVPDARDIVDDLTERGVHLDIGGSVLGGYLSEEAPTREDGRNDRR